MKILYIRSWGDLEDPSDYGVCGSCGKEIYCCSCHGGN